MLITSFLASMSMVLVSSKNYPGGVALQRIHNIQQDYNDGECRIFDFCKLSSFYHFKGLFYIKAK